MAPSRSTRLRRLNTLTRKIPYGRMPKWIIVVGGMPWLQEYNPKINWVTGQVDIKNT